MTTPYRFQNGDAHGDERPEPIPTYGGSPPRRVNFGERARLAARRLKVDPAWHDRTPESRRMLLDRDQEEGR